MSSFKLVPLTNKMYMIISNANEVEPPLLIKSYDDLKNATKRLSYLELIQLKDKDRNNTKKHSNKVWKPMRHQMNLWELPVMSAVYIQQKPAQQSLDN